MPFGLETMFAIRGHVFNIACSPTSLRDHEWEEQERSYHYTAVAKPNSLVRKVTALMLYSVRCPYYFGRPRRMRTVGTTFCVGYQREGRYMAGRAHLHYLKSIVPCPTLWGLEISSIDDS
ncbi:hypothetical protein EDB19DRAFT_259426 [Suillus lakei]|nr:hypothetical protein EDB19DRAFT_259426 [Suillus lakei]